VVSLNIAVDSVGFPLPIRKVYTSPGHRLYWVLFRGFPPCKCRIVLQMRPWPSLFTFLLIHYSLIYNSSYWQHCEVNNKFRQACLHALYGPILGNCLNRVARTHEPFLKSEDIRSTVNVFTTFQTCPNFFFWSCAWHYKIPAPKALRDISQVISLLREVCVSYIPELFWNKLRKRIFETKIHETVLEDEPDTSRIGS
jgi:hypothetical protein